MQNGAPLPALGMFGDPLGGLLFGGETLDYFGLAVGQTSTTQPIRDYLTFSRHESGSYSDISRICTYGAPVQAGGLTTIKPAYRNLRSTAILRLRSRS